MPTRAQTIVRAAFAAVLYVALVVAGWGFVSVLTDTEPISEVSTGPLVAPIGVAVSALVVFWCLARPGQRKLISGGATGTLLAALLVALTAVAGYLIAGGILMFFASGVLFDGLVFVSGQAVTGYIGALLVAALLSALGFSALRGREGTPQWPWEKNEFDR